jgi:hypothetical protein
MPERTTTSSTVQRRHPAASIGPIEAIWRAAALLRWHVPVLDGHDSALPYIALEEDEPVALFFTTRRRSRAAINGWIGAVSDMDVRFTLEVCNGSELIMVQAASDCRLSRSLEQCSDCGSRIPR